MNQENVQTTDKFFSDTSVACLIQSTFYDPDNPIEFDYEKLYDVLGLVPSTARRVCNEMYQANCISKSGFRKTPSYIITKENSLKFSYSVYRNQSHLNYIRRRRSNNRKSNSPERLQKRLYEKRGKKTAELTEQCPICHLWFSWRGLIRHRVDCHIEPLSFIRKGDGL